MAEKKAVGIGDIVNEMGIILWESFWVNFLQWLDSTDREDNFLF